MPKLTLTYFDFSASRGEECRLALHVAGVPFDDVRIKLPAWPQLRDETPYGALPVLEVEGRGSIAQSNAILAYVGRTHGLHPSDPFRAAQHEAVMAAVEDLRAHMGPIARIKDPAEKQRAREAAASGFLPTWARSIDRQIAEGPFLDGATLHVADIKLYVAVDAFVTGVVDHVPTTVFAGSPKLTALHAAVKRHPKVAEWQSRAH